MTYPNQASLRLDGFTAELGSSRAAAQFALTDGEWYVPFPSVGDVAFVYVGEPDWSSPPRTMADAAGAIIGVRSGELVPLHDIKAGPDGLDSRFAAGDFPRRRGARPGGGQEYFD